MILIVEDEVLARRALTMLLTSRGFATRAVGSAEEAMGLITRGQLPATALIDLDLPGMNGAELIRKLSRLLPEVRPILMTAAKPAQIARALAQMQVPTLRKPLDIHTLIAMLSES